MKTLILIIALYLSVLCSAQDTKIYPTIVTDYVTIDFGDAYEHIIRIYSMDGKLVYSAIKRSCTLPIDYQPAMYIVLIDNKYSYKIICQ
jgi:hypothetical protein